MAPAKIVGLLVTPLTASVSILRASSPESSMRREIWSDQTDTPAAVRPWMFDCGMWLRVGRPPGIAAMPAPESRKLDTIRIPRYRVKCT